jgi:hypothetical protein
MALVGGIRKSILASIHVVGILVLEGRKTKNCDFVDNPLEPLGLTLDKTKRHPMEHCMEG